MPAHRDGDILHPDAAGLEAVKHQKAVPERRFAEIHPQGRAVEPGGPTGDGQGDRRGRRVAELPGQVEPGELEAGGGLEAAVEVEDRTLDPGGIDPEAAVGEPEPGDIDGARTEKAAEVGRDERRDIAVDGKGETEAGIGAAQPQRSVDQPGVVGVEGERQVEGLERAAADEGEVEGRAALDAQQGRGNAPRRLGERDIEVEHPGGVGEGRLEAERPARSVEAAHVEPAVEHTVRQRDRAGQRDIGRLPEDRLAEGEAVDLDVAHLDRDRQLRQAEGPGLGLGQDDAGLLVRLRAAEKGAARGAEIVDPQPGPQQLQAAPVERDVVQLQPDTRVIGDGDPPDPRGRGDHAPGILEAHGAPGTGQAVLQLPDEESAVAVVLAAGLRLGLGESGDRDRQEADDEKGNPFQNACPMPM